MKNRGSPSPPLAPTVTGCSTITPYTLDISQQSPYFGKITAVQAVGIVQTQMKVREGQANYGPFVVDEEGFGYKKTTEEIKTEWIRWKGRSPEGDTYDDAQRPLGCRHRTESLMT